MCLTRVLIILIIAPCNNLNCGNNTDTCSQGICQCGDNPGLVCSAETEYPFCFNGECACTKTIGEFEPGDGTTQGSCKSASGKCHMDGRCTECTLASHCSGLSDTCVNGKCKCGNQAPCNPTKSNRCSSGVCYCGDNQSCMISNHFDKNGVDPRNNSYPGLQRTRSEVCEKITEFYNPRFIPNHPQLLQTTNGVTTTNGFEYDDLKGKESGTFQCLGKDRVVFEGPNKFYENEIKITIINVYKY